MARKQAHPTETPKAAEKAETPQVRREQEPVDLPTGQRRQHPPQ